MDQFKNQKDLALPLRALIFFILVAIMLTLAYSSYKNKRFTSEQLCEAQVAMLTETGKETQQANDAKIVDQYPHIKAWLTSPEQTTQTSQNVKVIGRADSSTSMGKTKAFAYEFDADPLTDKYHNAYDWRAPVIEHFIAPESTRYYFYDKVTGKEWTCRIRKNCLNQIKTEHRTNHAQEFIYDSTYFEGNQNVRFNH